MNATRAATIRLRSSFDGAVSLGRVQTPTLAIVARREEEIRAFVPEPYWLVDATFAVAGAEPGGPATDGDERVYVGRYHAPPKRGAKAKAAEASEASATESDADDVTDADSGDAEQEAAPAGQTRGPRIGSEREALEIVAACRDTNG